MSDSRVLVLAPVHSDPSATLGVLRRARIDAIVYESIARLLSHLSVCGGAVVLLQPEAAARLNALKEALLRQPPWSQVPVILVGASPRAAAGFFRARPLPGLTVLESPVDARTLVSVIRGALQARQRQYEVRAELEKLRRENRELREAARSKDDFLATLAHELRNPLSALGAAAQILRATGASAEPAVATARDVIARQVGQMTRILDDLSDVARITRTRLDLRKAHTSLAAVVTAAIETTRPLFVAKCHTLDVLLPQDDPGLQADAGRVAQVLSNLLANAAKYTEPGGRISIQGEFSEDTATIRVRDNGIGIARESLGSIFDMFTQLQPAVERSQGGLGIGLALARGIVELHGGTIEAFSEGCGAGSEFVVRLPRGAAQP